MELASPIHTSPADAYGTSFFSPPRGGGSGAGSRWCGGSPTAAAIVPQASPPLAPGPTRVADSDIPELRCACGEPCRVRTSRTPKNPGRKFYSCPFYQMACRPEIQNKKGCNFFKWVDDVIPLRVDAAAAAADPPTPQCPCQAGWCLRLTFDTGDQAGQKCFICPRKTQKCGFLQLCNLENPIGRNPGMTIQQSRDNFDQARPSCPCGAGPCIISIDSAGENAGTKWYVCPVRKGEGACNFRISCDSFRNREDFNASHGESQSAASLYTSDGLGTAETADAASSIMSVEREQEGIYPAPTVSEIVPVGYNSASGYRTPNGVQNLVINEAGSMVASPLPCIDLSNDNLGIACSPLDRPVTAHVGSPVTPHRNTGVHINLSRGGSSFSLPNEKIGPSYDKSAVDGSSSRAIISEGFMLSTFASPSSQGNNLVTAGRPSVALQYPSSKHMVLENNFGSSHIPSSPASCPVGSPYHDLITGRSPSTIANNKAAHFLIPHFATRDVQDDNLAGEASPSVPAVKNAGYGFLSPGSTLASPVTKMRLHDADLVGDYVAHNNGSMDGLKAKEGLQNTISGGRSSSSRVGACYRCGKDGHWVIECSLPPSSPAGLCWKCGGVGHWAKDCTSLH